MESPSPFQTVPISPKEVRFDKSKGTVELMNSRFLEKLVFGYRRKSKFSKTERYPLTEICFRLSVVTELERVVSVSVETQQVSPGIGYMVRRCRL